MRIYAPPYNILLTTVGYIIYYDCTCSGTWSHDFLISGIRLDSIIDFIDYVTGIGNGAFRASGPCCAQNAFCLTPGFQVGGQKHCFCTDTVTVEAAIAK